MLEDGGDWKKFIAYAYNTFTVSSNLGEANSLLNSSFQVRNFGSLFVNVAAVVTGIVIVALIVAQLTAAKGQALVEELVEGMREEAFDDCIDKFRYLRLQASKQKYRAHGNFDEIIKGLYDIAQKRTPRATVQRINIHEFETIIRHCLYRMIKEHDLFESDESTLRHDTVYNQLDEITRWVEEDLMQPPAELRQHLVLDEAGQMVDEELIAAWQEIRDLPKRIDDARKRAASPT